MQNLHEQLYIEEWLLPWQQLCQIQFSSPQPMLNLQKQLQVILKLKFYMLIQRYQLWTSGITKMREMCQNPFR